jgi:hypothetical protein
MLLPKSMGNQQKSSAKSKQKCCKQSQWKTGKKKAVQNEKQHSCYQSQSKTSKIELQKLCSFLL